MQTTDFPKSVTFLRNENSIIDYTNEDVEGEFVVTVRADLKHAHVGLLSPV
jgi:hypothetical protein